MDENIEWFLVIGFTDGDVMTIPCEDEAEAIGAVNDVHDGMRDEEAKVMISDHAVVRPTNVRYAFVYSDDADDDE